MLHTGDPPLPGITAAEGRQCLMNLQCHCHYGGKHCSECWCVLDKCVFCPASLEHPLSSCFYCFIVSLLFYIYFVCGNHIPLHIGSLLIKNVLNMQYLYDEKAVFVLQIVHLNHDVCHPMHQFFKMCL